MLINAFTGKSFAQTVTPFVDFDAYENLVAEVKEHRKTRLLDVNEFLSTSKEEKVIILDTRSDSMYNAAHVKGAIHLNFSDFTQVNLAKVIPSPDYKILIYCNNNFDTKLEGLTASSAVTIQDLRPYFVTKMASPPINTKSIFIKPAKSTQLKKEKKGPSVSVIEETNESPITAKPLTLALNIPTYINLYGYGYHNVYELSELVNVNSGLLEFEGTEVKK